MTRLDEITDRLRTVASELSDPELEEDRSAELTREAAELAAEAAQEADRALQEAPADE